MKVGMCYGVVVVVRPYLVLLEATCDPRAAARKFMSDRESKGQETDRKTDTDIHGRTCVELYFLWWGA